MLVPSAAWLLARLLRVRAPALGRPLRALGWQVREALAPRGQRFALADSPQLSDSEPARARHELAFGLGLDSFEHQTAGVHLDATIMLRTKTA